MKSKLCKTLQRTLGIVLALTALIGVAGHTADKHADNAAAPPLFKQRVVVFGTYIDMVATKTTQQKADAAFKEIEQELNYIDRVWNPYRPSAVARMNKMLPGTVWFSMAPSVRDLLTRSMDLEKASNHLFNPAIGKLIKLWGFNDATQFRKSPPPADQIKALVKANPRLSDLSLQGIRLKTANPAVQLDFGAIAKGYAVDLAISILKRRGIHNAIVNAGGDLKCIGTRGNRPWRIAIRNPRSNKKVFASVLVDHEEAVFTSGDYERYFIYKNKRYHHLIDPRTGYPATQTRSVTVITPDATLADAAATALFIAGPSQWRAIAKQMKVDTVLLVDQKGVLHMTPKMQQRLKLYTGKDTRIDVVPLEGKP